MYTHLHVLSQGCLLTLCADGDASGKPLTEALNLALQGGFPSVWVDCRHVATLSADAVRRLRQCAAQLWRHGSYLLLCHLPPGTRTSPPARTAAQPLAACLLDAALYGFDCPSPHL